MLSTVIEFVLLTVVMWHQLPCGSGKEFRRKKKEKQTEGCFFQLPFFLKTLVILSSAFLVPLSSLFYCFSWSIEQLINSHGHLPSHNLLPSLYLLIACHPYLFLLRARKASAGSLVAWRKRDGGTGLWAVGGRLKRRR